MFKKFNTLFKENLGRFFALFFFTFLVIEFKITSLGTVSKKNNGNFTYAVHQETKKVSEKIFRVSQNKVINCYIFILTFSF